VIATRARVWTPGLLVAVALLACESAPQVRSDYDKAADFGAFHTYNFVSQPSTDKLGYSSLLTQQIESAVATEMEKRGYMRSEHPDLLVNFSGKLQRTQKVESSPSAVGPYYGYRVGLYGAWPGYGNDVYTVNYTEGTLNIDLVDAARKQMVWEGVGVGEVTEEKQQSRQATLNAAVAAIFAKFPFRAGQSQPVATPTGR
jgi:hypothetical protein